MEKPFVNQKMKGYGSVGSVIRELFEYGMKQAKIVGKENVFDFSIGNPTVPAPPCVNESIKKIVDTRSSIEVHGYTSAVGDYDTRKAIADYLNKTYETHFKPENFFIACGCAPGLAAVFRTLTVNEQEDEFIAIAPYFPEYNVFCPAKLLVVPPDTENFQINFAELEKMINKHTKGLIINSPNNPSGVIYSRDTIIKLGELLNKKAKEFDTHIILISDEPYREIAYDGVEVPYVTKYYNDTVVCYSFSKSLSLPGERLGFVLVPDECYMAKDIFDGVKGASRSNGHVCAPSLLQKVIAMVVGNTGDINIYKKNRDLLYKGLTDLGYKCVKPEGAFYMFVKCLEDDDKAFSDKAKEFNLLLVPAKGFGCAGYVRVAYCVDYEMIERSFAAFKKLKESYDKK